MAKIVIIIAVLAVAIPVLAMMWTSMGWWNGGMMGGGVVGPIWQSGVPATTGCPMMGGMWGWGGGYVNDTNVVNYVRQNFPQLEIIEVEKYEYNYYVILGKNGRPLYEVLVYPNGFIHFEHQSMMWRYGYNRITPEEARRIAEQWITTYFPGGEIEEEYVFPGYYTFHFKYNGDMQMLSVNGLTSAVWYHSWHGRHIATIFES